MQHLEGSGTPVLYIGRTVLKGNAPCQFTSLLNLRSGLFGLTPCGCCAL
jgi:hypothetical protein